VAQGGTNKPYCQDGFKSKFSGLTVSAVQQDIDGAIPDSPKIDAYQRPEHTGRDETALFGG
jgi:hypothetical protein